jgi:tripartite-type tricarboxylate transporter receptor subunit TctC
MGITRQSHWSVAAAAALAMGLSSAALAQDSVEEFYSNNDLTILLGHPPGGSYDLYGQLAAAHLGRFLPGNPNVIVQHMPGGGGARGAAHFLNNVEGDGSMVAILPDTLAHIQLLDPERGNWDVSKVEYIGRFAPTNSAFAVGKHAQAQSIEEMKDIETTVSCTGVSARSAQMPVMLNKLGGYNFKLVCGYPGSKDATLAILRGEADVTSKAWASFRSGDAAEIEAGNMTIFLQAGLERDPELPDVPLMQEVVDDERAQRIIRFVSAGAPIGRSMMAAPGTPPEFVAALREAFQEMIQDEDFLADAKQRNALIVPATGEEVQAVNVEIFETPQDIIDEAKAAMDAES